MQPLPCNEVADVLDQLARGELVEEPVVLVAPEPPRDMIYDLSVEDDASFIADGVVVHNSAYCRHMHGRTFSVRSALDQFDALDRLEDPEAVKEARPWVREALDRETGASTLFVTKGGARVVLAEGRPTGAPDGGVTYRARVSDQDLETLGTSLPPAHALCRSSVSTI